MSKKFFQTNEFKRLNSEWKRKLKDSGFQDIETENDMELNHINKQMFEPNVEYIRYNNSCFEHLNSGKITDQLDQAIFEFHCQGLSTYEIREELLKIKIGWNKTARTIQNRILKILKDAEIEPVEFNR